MSPGERWAGRFAGNLSGRVIEIVSVTGKYVMPKVITMQHGKRKSAAKKMKISHLLRSYKKVGAHHLV